MTGRHAEIASALPADLDGLPRLGGFRVRGIQMTRLETFIDAEARALFAIFAIGFTAIALEIMLLYLRAWQLREPLRLNAYERSSRVRR